MWLRLVMELSLSFAFGIVIARLVEVPGLRLRDRLYPSRSGPIGTLTLAVKGETRSMTVTKYQIGEVAQAIGLSISTMRHWDEMGVVEPSGRSNGGFRLYTDDDIARLRWVMRLKPMKLTLEEIRELLELKDRAASGSLSDDDRGRLEFFALAADASGRKLREQLSWSNEIATELHAAARRGTTGGARHSRAGKHCFTRRGQSSQVRTSRRTSSALALSGGHLKPNSSVRTRQRGSKDPDALISRGRRLGESSARVAVRDAARPAKPRLSSWKRVPA